MRDHEVLLAVAEQCKEAEDLLGECAAKVLAVFARHEAYWPAEVYLTVRSIEDEIGALGEMPLFTMLEGWMETLLVIPTTSDLKILLRLAKHGRELIATMVQDHADMEAAA